MSQREARRIGDIHDQLTAKTTLLYNAIVDMGDLPDAHNRFILRTHLKGFNSLVKLLTRYAQSTLKKPLKA